nr:hypothetical protein BaRGS_015666 [Batillaria attramentaria]
MKFNSKSRTRRILAATWVIPVVLASPYTFSKSYAFVISSEMGSISRQICTDRFDEIDTLMYGSGVSGRFRSGFFIFLFLVIYLLPMLVILATCVRIAICLLQPISVRRWPPATRKDTGRRHEENKRKVARMVIVVAVAFIVSWSPFYLSTLVSQIQIMKQEDSFLRERNFLFTMLMIHLCGFLNSCINPLIYTGMSKKFRRSFKKILGGCICCRLGHRFLRYRDSLNRGMSAAFTSSYRQSMTEVRDANDLGLSEAGSSSADSTTRYSTRSNPTANNGSQRGNHGNLLQRNIYHQRRHNNNQHLHHHHHHLHNVDQEQLQTSPDLKKKGGFRLLKSRDQGDVLIQLKPMKKKGNAETDEQHEASLLTKPRAGSAEDLAKEEDTTPIVINRREPGSDDEDDVEQGTQLLLKKDNSAGALFKEDDLAPKANGSARTVANGGSHQILRDRSGEWKPRTDKRQGEGVMMSDVVRGTQVTRHVPNQYEEVVHAGFLQDGQCVQL